MLNKTVSLRLFDLAQHASILDCEQSFVLLRCVKDWVSKYGFDTKLSKQTAIVTKKSF